MKFQHLSLALLLLATSMSGCLGLFGDDDATDPCDPHSHDDEMDINQTEEMGMNHSEEGENHHPECEEEGDDHDDNVTEEQPTPSTPNLPAVVEYTVTNDMGEITNVTMQGGNLTFSANGTFDPDGQLQLVAITLYDGNNSRVASLYANGEYTPATFNMDVSGVANVTINALDQRGDLSSVTGQVFTNSMESTVSHTFTLGAPVGVSADACSPPGGSDGTAVTSSFTRAFKFSVKDNASYVTAVPNVTPVNAGAPGVQIAICDPAGNAISIGSTGAVTTDVGTVFSASIDYYVFAVSQAPQNSVDSIDITVGFDAHPAA